MGGHQGDEAVIRAYVADQADEDVVHVEHAASEMVGPVRHEVWDVHCTDSRWWVVTNPTNLYDQADFKSRDVVLTFHIGLALRVAYLNERRVPVAPQPALLLPGYRQPADTTCRSGTPGSPPGCSRTSTPGSDRTLHRSST
jgi:hypothetical protein